MCGIVGAFGEIAHIPPQVFSQALVSLAHRGPDASAEWRGGSAILGHRRLSVIDLSEAGTQPMIDPETGLVIVFNGEIYNYLELRAELEAEGHRFRTVSDTEVLLKGYIEWGTGVLARCNGMWAFAIWDPSTRRAFLARDRFGVKPLYYAVGTRRMLFASEPKALHVLDRSLTEPDSRALVELVVNSRMHAGARTFFRSLSAVPAAHFAIYEADRNRLAVRRYWDYPIANEQADSSGENSSAHFGEIFEDAVKLRLRSDVPVGLTLSGGLDSSAVLAATAAVGSSPLRCYTSVFSQSLRGEEKWAKIASRLAGTIAEPVETRLEDWLSTLKNIVRHMDAPGYSPAVLPLWSIMARARRDAVPVLLEGQGADELLAGYAQYAAEDVIAQLRARKFHDAFSGVQQMSQTFTSGWTAAWLARCLLPKTVVRITRDRRLLTFHPEIVQDWRAQGEDPTLSSVGADYDPVRAALWRDHAINILPALLHYGDAVSMAHGIESRLPFMDYRLVEWVFRDRPSLMEQGRTKSMVRDYLCKRGFNTIANRRDKLGYPVPVLEWYRNFGKSLLADVVAEPGAQIWEIMRRPQAKSLMTSAERGSTRGVFHIYKIVTMDIWLRQMKIRRCSHDSQESPLADGRVIA
jgi:asparagine synthase (glutamine-hydrolysing)